MSEHHPDSDYACPPIEANFAPLRRVAFLAAFVGAVAFVGLGVANASINADHGGVRDFFLTYQAAFVFWLSVPVA